MPKRAEAVHSKDCYTLLADESSMFANSPEHYKLFKAHVVLNLILNSSIVFSDSQAVLCSNLRRLVRDDEVVRQLLRQRQFGLACRANFDPEAPDRMASLEEVHMAFLRHGKLKHVEHDFANGKELLFLEEYAVRQPWNYGATRGTYSDTCQRILFGEFREVLSDHHNEIFQNLLLEEREKAHGLGRVFLDETLVEQMKANGIPFDEKTDALLHACTQAPYLSNLPEMIGLDPIYSHEHRESFELVRGRRARFIDIDEPEELEMKLDHEHFIEGLNWLDVEDIGALQRSAERQRYLELIRLTAQDAKHFDDLLEAFIALNIRIEDRIIQRSPALKTHSTTGTKRRFRKQAVTATDYGVTVGLDLIALAVELVGRTLMPGLGILSKVLLDVGRKAIVGDEDTETVAEIAARETQFRRVKRDLRAKGADEAIKLEVVPAKTFDKEIVVTAA